MKRRKWALIGAISSSIMLLIGLITFGIALGVIFRGVQEISELAKNQFGGDHVGALMAMIESEEATYKEKNTAIWALGQIGDPRALPLLISLDTDEVQTIPYDSSKHIVQYEVEKAIRQINSKFVVTRWMYRWLE